MNANLPVREILFPENCDPEMDSLQSPAILRLGSKLLTRLGRKVLNLADSDSCIVNCKQNVIFFDVYQYCPFRHRKVPVRDIHDEIISFVSRQVREVGAGVTKIEWSWKIGAGFRLDIHLEPSAEPDLMPAWRFEESPADEAAERRSLEILKSLAV